MLRYTGQTAAEVPRSGSKEWGLRQPSFPWGQKLHEQDQL